MKIQHNQLKKNFNKELRKTFYLLDYWFITKGVTQKQPEGGDAQGKIPGGGGGVPDTPSS